MLLSELLTHIVPPSACDDIEVKGLTLDSRQLVVGDVFFACASESGGADKRLAYAQEAIAKGAAAVLIEGKEGQDTTVSRHYLSHTHWLPVIEVPMLKRYIGDIAARFYNHPTAHMFTVGVTGTNGKTSFSHFLANMLGVFGQDCGIVGTMGTGFAGDLKEASMTTPDAVFLQQSLAQLRVAQAQAVVIEASSHGLSQGRLGGVEFDVGVFTNLSHDHLDYHNTMTEYAAAKEKLFTETGLHTAVINLDDSFGNVWARTLHKNITVYGYGSRRTRLSIPYVQLLQTNVNEDGVMAAIKTPWGDGVLRSPVLGRFNLDNLLAVLTTLCAMGLPLDQVLSAFEELKPVPGRMQTFGKKGKQPLVVVDYAHTPDALGKALVSLREHRRGKVWCVMGCGGDRDQSKRQIMGRIAERYSDELIITDDNPRTEDPRKIVEDIMAGLLCPWAAKVEHDRESAIIYAVQNAAVNDIVLIAGKGHEKYQQIGKEKLPFNDVEIVESQLG